MEQILSMETERNKTIKQLRMIADDLEKGYGGFEFLIGIDLESLASVKINNRDDGLTDQEGKVMDALVAAWNEFRKLEMTHPSDNPDFAKAIHICQQILGMRVLQRDYPTGWPIKK